MFAVFVKAPSILGRGERHSYQKHRLGNPDLQKVATLSPCPVNTGRPNGIASAVPKRGRSKRGRSQKHATLRAQRLKRINLA